MRATEWRSQEDSEQTFQLQELRKRLFELRFKGSSEEISDTKELVRVRRDIARLLTLQRERELGIHPRAPQGEPS
jgi:large subunit ribosomal protein L29